VTLWAPFHVMIGTGMGLAGVGAIVQFAAIRTGGRIAREIALPVAIAVTCSTFMVFLAESAGRRGLLQVGDATLALYPVLLSIALPAVAVIASTAIARPGAALAVALVIQIVRQALFLFVPWATITLVAIEGQVFRPNAPTWTTTPNAFPGLSLVVVALAVEAAAWWARRRGQSIHLPVVLTAVIATLPASFIDRPWEALVPRFYPPVDLTAAGWNAVLFVLAGAVVGTFVGLCLGLAISRAHHTSSARTVSRVVRLAPAALLLIAFAGNGVAFAHDIAPEATTQARVGPYTVDVRYYTEPVGGRVLSFEIVPVGDAPAPSVYTVIAVPGPTTSATPVRAHLTPAIDHAGQTGLVNLPFGGKWLLDVEVDGPLGPGSADVPVIAALPTAVMPEWLAWMIGTLPLSTLSIFVVARLIGLGPSSVAVARSAAA
jgi:hypothetical protein